MSFLNSNSDLNKWIQEKQKNPNLEIEFRFGKYHPQKQNFISNLPEPTWLKIKDIISKNKDLKEEKQLLSIQCYQEQIRKETFYKEVDDTFIKEKTEYLIKKKITTKDFKSNGLRFSVQTETPAPKHFQVDKVCFQKCNRLKKRFQFIFDGFVVDMTQVKQTHNNECLDDFKNSLQETKNNKDFFNQYELEIEIDNKIPHDLIQDILQIIQSNKNINHNKNSVTIPNYLRSFIKSKTNQVIGLKIENLPTISVNYSITDKADGERYFLFCQSNSKAFLFNKHFQGKTIHFSKKNKNNKNADVYPFCVEGEYLRISGKPHFFIFDIFLLSGMNQITEKTQIERIAEIEKLLPLLNSAVGITITLKKFYFYNKDFGLSTKTSLYQIAKEVWEKEHPYHLDGLIFTPQLENYNGKIFKWKPPEEKSIDFFIKFEGTEPFSFSAGLSQQILNLSLYVSLSKNKDEHHLLDIQKILREYPQYRRSNTFPLLFQDENKHILGKTKLICDIKEINGFPTAFCNDVPILHQTVVEFIWNNKDGHGNGPWIPIKVRKDKTQDFLLAQEKGEFRGPNAYKTAIDTWKGIQEEFPLALLEKL